MAWPTKVFTLTKRPSSFSCSAQRMRRCTGFKPSARFGMARSNDVGGVIQKAAVHSPVQRQVDFCRLEGMFWRGKGHVFGQHMGFAIVSFARFCLRLAIAVCGGTDFDWPFIGGVGAFDWQFRLVGILFAF